MVSDVNCEQSMQFRTLKKQSSITSAAKADIVPASLTMKKHLTSCMGTWEPAVYSADKTPGLHIHTIQSVLKSNFQQILY